MHQLYEASLVFEDNTSNIGCPNFNNIESQNVRELVYLPDIILTS